MLLPPSRSPLPSPYESQYALVGARRALPLPFAVTVHSAGAGPPQSPAPRAPLAGRRPRVPGDSRSRPTAHHPYSARDTPQSGESLGRRPLGRRGSPRAALRDQASLREASSPLGHKTSLLTDGARLSLVWTLDSGLWTLD